MNPIDRLHESRLYQSLGVSPGPMQSIYDYLTMAIFAGLIVLFLQRSVGEEEYRDHLWQYLVAAVGCAAANFAGNEGYPIVAVALIIATLAFIHYVLKPFERTPR
jgi:hypothetical protein